MEQTPKPFIVYWTSQFDGDDKGWYTPKYKANMKAFDTAEAANKLHLKLQRILAEGGKYGSRKVYHVPPSTGY